ncbi:MAG: site-specific integrase [Candidatus Bathyarchaeia archaeon]
MSGQDLSLSPWDVYLKNLDERTAENYRLAVRRFFEVVGRKDSYTENDVIFFINSLRDQGLASTTIRNMLAGVKAYFTINGDNRINWKFIKSFLPKKRVIRDARPIPRDVAREIVRAANGNRRLLFWFLWATGARIGEALALKRSDFDFSEEPAKVTIMTEKRMVPRTVFIPSDLAKALKNHLDRLGPDDYVFHVRDNPKKPLPVNKARKSFWGVLARLGLLQRDRSGKGYAYTLHSFRKNFETLLTQAGMNQMFLSILLGHDIGVKAAYFLPTEQEIKDEWKKYEHCLRLDIDQPRPEQVEEINKRVKELEQQVEGLTNLLSIFLENEAKRLEGINNEEQLKQVVQEYHRRLAAAITLGDREKIIAEARRIAALALKTMKKKSI